MHLNVNLHICALQRVIYGPLLVGGLVLGCASSIDQSDDESASSESAVVNGTVASSNGLHNGALYHQVYNLTGLPAGWVWFPRPCTADRISLDGWYLTARHCVTSNGESWGTLVSASQLRITEALAPGLATYGSPPSGVTTVQSVVDYSWMADIALVYAPSVGTLGRGQVPGIMAASGDTLLNSSVSGCGYGQFVFNNDNSQASNPVYGAGTLRCMPDKQISGNKATDFAPMEIFFSELINSGTIYPAHGDSGSSVFLKNTAPNTLPVWANAGVHGWGQQQSSGFTNFYYTVTSEVLPWIKSNVGWFYIKYVNSTYTPDMTRYLDVQWNNSNWETPVWAYAYMGSPAQHWSYSVSTRTIANENGLCLDVKGGGSADGTPVQMYGCNNTLAQKWAFTKDFKLTSGIGGKCLTVPLAAGTPDGKGTATLVIKSCNSVDVQQQQWMLSAAP